MKLLGISKKYEFATLRRDREASQFSLHGRTKCRTMPRSPEVLGKASAHERQQKLRIDNGS